MEETKVTFYGGEKTRWKLVLIIGVVLVLVIGGIYFMSSNNMTMQSLFAGKQEGVSGLDLTGIDSFEIKDGLSKNYTSEDERVIVKDTKDDTTIIDIKLTSPINNFVGVGNDIKIAEFQVEDFSTITELFDRIDFYDLKDNLKIKPRDFTYKYATEYLVETCQNLGDFKEEKVVCFNSTETNWTEFTDTKTLPSKNIRVGLFTRTYPNENIEWIPTIKDFEISEWATFFVNSYETVDQTNNDTNLVFYNFTLDNIPTNDTVLILGIYAQNIQNAIPTLPNVTVSGVEANYTGLDIARATYTKFWLFTAYSNDYSGQRLLIDFGSDDMNAVYSGVVGVYNGTNTNNGLDLIVQSNTSFGTSFVNVTGIDFIDSINNAPLALYRDCGTCNEDELGSNLTKISSDATADFLEFSVGQSGQPTDLWFSLDITAGSESNVLEIFLLEIQPESDGEPPADCWTYDSGSKYLQIPTGCLYTGNLTP